MRRAANCAAAGITQPFSSNIVEFTIPITVAGNPDLENEVADSWTLGAVIQPRFLPRFALTIDWIEIALNNAIVTLGSEQTLEACYDAPDFPNQFCNAVTRDPAGQITTIQTGFANAASFDFRGLTTSLNWTLPLPAGLGTNPRLILNGNYLYIDRLQQRVGTGDVNVLRGGIGNSKHQATASATFATDPFSWQVQAQYLSSATFDPNEPAGTRDPRGVGDWWLFNTSLNWNINDRLGLRFIVNNVFDRNPPFPVPAGGGTTTYFSGILGRNFRVGASVKF